MLCKEAKVPTLIYIQNQKLVNTRSSPKFNLSVAEMHSSVSMGGFHETVTVEGCLLLLSAEHCYLPTMSTSPQD
jgi:hypothetical protein